MSYVTTAAPPLARAAPEARHWLHLKLESAFWCQAIGTGALATQELRTQIDALSLRVAALPIHVSVTRPVVGQYLVTLKRLANAWTGRNKQALDGAMAGLLHFGAGLAQAATVDALSESGADNGRAARSTLDALQRRLEAPQAALAALDADLTSYLRHMALASAELELDTRLVTEQLQAGAVQALSLSQLASTLQGRLDDARRQEHAHAPAGPHTLGLSQEICLHASALEGVRRQLDPLRAEQAATQAEASYLGTLMPVLSPYLAVLERMGAAVASLLAGTCAVALELDRLRQALEHDASAAGEAAPQHTTALAPWRALAACQRPAALS